MAPGLAAPRARNPVDSASPDSTKNTQTASRPSNNGASQALLIHGTSRVSISWKVW